MKREKVYELILIAIITLFVLSLSSCATYHQQCAAYASVEIK